MKRTALAGATALLTICGVLGAQSYGQGGDYDPAYTIGPRMMEGYSTGLGMMGWGSTWFGMVHMLLWWALVILGIVVLVRFLVAERPGARNPQQPQRALEILAERYARGEIDQTEFEQKKRDLNA